MNLVKHTYGEECTFLLKDLTGIAKEITLIEKEKLISQGVNYSEMISKEFAPSAQMNYFFKEALKKKGIEIANYIAQLSEEIYAYKGRKLVLVSLARAGTPIGVLVKRYLQRKYGFKVAHFSVSIIRGKGIDENALKYILLQNKPESIQFIDGWTGKGLIIDELYSAIVNYNQKNEVNIDPTLAVLADPAKRCIIYGTRQDICIPNCCLNGTVSGLVSRTIHNSSLINKNEFHGAIYLADLEKYDVSNVFIDTIDELLPMDYVQKNKGEPVDELYSSRIESLIQTRYHVNDLKKIKLSIGESTRVLLRRKPRLLLVNNLHSSEVTYIVKLAKEKGVLVEEMPPEVKGQYEAIALIDESDYNE